MGVPVNITRRLTSSALRDLNVRESASRKDECAWLAATLSKGTSSRAREAQTRILESVSLVAEQQTDTTVGEVN